MSSRTVVLVAETRPAQLQTSRDDALFQSSSFGLLALAGATGPEAPAGIVAEDGKTEKEDQRAAGDREGDRLEPQIERKAYELDGVGERVRLRDRRQHRARVLEPPQRIERA